MPAEPGRGYRVEPGEDARETPVRLLFVQEEERAAVDADDADLVMTVPHLIFREAIAFVLLAWALAVLALVLDAPLEEMANPARTPNPAKAPWYFLGLQELLHYFPPVIAGVLLPAAVVVALLVVPYFEVNLKRQPLWGARKRRELLVLWGVVAGVLALATAGANYVPWVLLAPTVALAVLASAPGFLPPSWRAVHWLAERSVPFWIFVWFTTLAVVLTAVGTLFRGPGWSLTLPWREGIF